MPVRLLAPLASTAAAALALSACDAGPTTTSPAPIPWSKLANPVFGLPDQAVKDAFAIRRGDQWHLGYSDLREDPFRVRVGLADTSDWRDFVVREVQDDPQVGGLASPDVVRMPDGRSVMTYNSHTHDVGGASNKLYYRTSEDLATWSEGRRLVVEGADAPEDRLIDAALAFADSGAYLFFKREQAAHVAHAPSGDIEGPWTLLGQLEPINLENIQVLRIDGVWHMLGTTIPIDHRPVLHRLEGDEDDPVSWRTWSVIGELEVPEQSWNTGVYPGYERSNAAYLIDERDVDGFFYLLYAGSTELSSYEGRGHSSLGLARSVDFSTWEVPPER